MLPVLPNYMYVRWPGCCPVLIMSQLELSARSPVQIVCVCGLSARLLPATVWITAKSWVIGMDPVRIASSEFDCLIGANWIIFVNSNTISTHAWFEINWTKTFWNNARTQSFGRTDPDQYSVPIRLLRRWQKISYGEVGNFIWSDWQWLKVHMNESSVPSHITLWRNIISFCS